MVSLSTHGYLCPFSRQYISIPIESASASVEVETEVEVSITVDLSDLEIDVLVVEDLNVSVIIGEEG